eukprot:SAG31_NODE_8098_length_1524_cov_0.995088_1_plen_159_part_00
MLYATVMSTHISSVCHCDSHRSHLLLCVSDFVFGSALILLPFLIAFLVVRRLHCIGSQKRLSNPTSAVLEERLATLEGGRGATTTSSGHAAQLLVLFTLCEPGSTIVASNKLYGGSITQFDKTIRKFGWNALFVDVEAEWRADRGVGWGCAAACARKS